jgi:heme-degrading monooxygenase HmoA
MYLILWEFTVRPERAAEFERAYGTNGDWAKLFARSARYRGTELLRDRETAGRYLTIDRWTSGDAYEAFERRWRAEYDALDGKCETLTLTERRLGGFVV